MPIRTKLRRIGDSVGVILPKRELELRRLREGDEVEIPGVYRLAARELFGAWKERPAKVGENLP